LLTLVAVQRKSTITVTQAPQTALTTPTTSAHAIVSGTLVAAIVVSSTLLLLAAVAGLVFFLYRRRKRTKKQSINANATEVLEISSETAINEKEGLGSRKVELVGDLQWRNKPEYPTKATSVYEMYQPAVELDGSYEMVVPERSGRLNTKQSWI
jgi:hypothetical protein